MKVFLKHSLKAVVFMAGLLVFLIAASAILLPRNNREEDWKHDVQAHGILAEPENTIDVLFIGDSEVYSSINPLRIWQSYGYTSYCLSASKQRLWYSLEFFNMAMRTQQPKIVVLETNSLFKAFPAEDSMMHSMDHVLPVFKFHDRWKCLKFEDIFRSPQYTHIENRKGYRLYKESDPADIEGYMEESENVEYISFLNKIYINIIASTCKQQDIKLVFLSTPSTMNWNMRKHNRMEKLSEELGTDYLDLNLAHDGFSIDWEKDTRDKGDHMNYFGAEKVTAYVGSYLNSTGILVRHEEKAICKAWNKALKTFTDDVDKWLSTLAASE